MKITEITSKSIETLTAELKASGISEKKLDQARETSFLSEGEVKFVDYSINGDDATEKQQSTKYICLTTDKGETVSMSRLQASLFIPQTEEVAEETLKAVARINGGTHEGKFYLKTNTVINPFLQGNQASALKKLVGKTFICKHIPGLQSVYKSEGYFSAEEVETKTVTLFQLIQK